MQDPRNGPPVRARAPRCGLLGQSETLVGSCVDACDSNDSGAADFTDAINILEFLFLGTGEIASPAPIPGGTHPCGSDPTDDDAANCNSYMQSRGCQ